MINLLDYTLDELTDVVLKLNEPKFRAKQLYNAILNGKDFSDQTVLPKSLIDKLKEGGFKMQPLKIYKSVTSKDKSVKFLYKLNDDNIIEGMLMKHSYGNTLCVSTQIGCKMNCAFCASGLNFVRNLSVGEILGQIVVANKFLGGTVSDRKITNIVLMGSGEPLDNFDNVTKFLKVLTDDNTFNFSVRNITLSTCGIPSKIEKLADMGLNINLAISLHASNNEARKQIMPVAKSFPIESVIEAAKYYHTITNRMIYIEYTLIDGINSSVKHAQELVKLLSELSCRVNLIGLNEVKERGLKGVSESKTNAFLRELLKNGLSATIRRSLGDDVDGACGQLRNKELGLTKSAPEQKFEHKKEVNKQTKNNRVQKPKHGDGNLNNKKQFSNVKQTRSNVYKSISKSNSKQKFYK